MSERRETKKENTICFPITKYYQRDPKYKDCAWRVIEEKLGSGQFGTVYPACCNADCKYVAKFIPFSRESESRFLKSATLEQVIAEGKLLTTTPEKFEKEVEIQSLCAAPKYNVCVPVLDSWRCEHGGMIIMPALRITLQNLLLNTVHGQDIVKLDKWRRIALMLMIIDAFYTVKKLHELGYVHNDFKPDNIMANYVDPPAAVPSANYLDWYLKSKFDWKLIDLGKAKPIETPDDAAFDYKNLAFEIKELLKYFTDAVFEGQDINILDNFFLVLEEMVLNSPMEETINVLKDETTYFSDDILPKI
jgi:serine/threonine protein kinase